MRFVEPEPGGWDRWPNGPCFRAFSVRDNGIGLPNDSAMFEMFTPGRWRARAQRVGLATCRWIVEARGGRSRAEPTPGGASTFHFTLST
jgi:signal transduction histidine kinase